MPLRDPPQPWAVWRLVIEKVASLREIEEFWSIDDLADANDALDCMREAEAANSK